MSKTLWHIFQELNLIHLYEPFEVERIEVDNFLCLSDEEMERLGVSALGDRIRLRESVRFELGDKKTDKKRTEPKESTTTSSALFLERNRSILFGRAVRRQLVQKVGQQTFFVWRTKKQRLFRRLHSEKCCIKQALGQRKSNYLHRIEKLKY